MTVFKLKLQFEIYSLILTQFNFFFKIGLESTSDKKSSFGSMEELSSSLKVKTHLHTVCSILKNISNVKIFIYRMFAT